MKSMFWKLSLLVSFVAAASAVYNIVAGTENWGPSFIAAAIMFTVAAVLLVGPYLILGIIALMTRSNRTISLVLFTLILLFSVLGTTALSWETYAYLNRDKTQPDATNLGLLFIGMGQWFAATLFACITLPIYFYLRNENRLTSP